MALPSKVKPGDPIKATDWNALIDFVRSAQVNPSSGVRVTRTPSGTTLAVDSPLRRRVASPDGSFPFKLRGYVDSDDQGWISVAYGEVNEVPPTRDDDTQMGEEDEPYAMKADDDGVVFIKVKIDQITREVIEFKFSMESDEESIPADGVDEETGEEYVHFILGRFYIDNSQEGEEENGPPVPVPMNYIREHIGMTEYTVRRQGTWKRDFFRTFTRAPLAASDSLFPFELGGYVKEGQAHLTVAYGEVNQVAPEGMFEGSDPVDFEINEKGVAYVSIRVDSKTFEVIDCYVSLEQNDESIPEDTDDGESLTFAVVLGRFYLDEDGNPVTFNLVSENINFSTYPVIAPDGRLCIDFIHTYSRDPLLRDSLHLSVYDADNLSTESQMYLTVNDDDPENDGMVFEGNGNTVKTEWFYGPGLYMADADQFESRLSSVGASFWDANGTKENPECDISIERLRIWDNNGYGTHHYASGLAFWDNAANAGNPQCDLNLERLRIFDNDGYATQHYASGISFWDNEANSTNPQCDLNHERLYIFDMGGDGIIAQPLGLKLWTAESNKDNPESYLTAGYLKQFDPLNGNAYKISANQGLHLWDSASNDDTPKVLLNLQKFRIWDDDGFGLGAYGKGIGLWDNTANEDNPQVNFTCDYYRIWDNEGYDGYYRAKGVSVSGTEGDRFDLTTGSLYLQDAAGAYVTYGVNGVEFINGADSATMDAYGFWAGDAYGGTMELGSFGLKVVNANDGSSCTIDEYGFWQGDGYGSEVSLDCSGLGFVDGAKSATMDAGGFWVGDGEDSAIMNAAGFYVGNASLVDLSCTVGPGGGFYVENASLTNAACTVDTGGGFYVGNASLTSGACTVEYGFYVGGSSLTESDVTASTGTFDYLSSSGGADFGGDVSVGANLDAASISSNSITYGGTELDAYIDDSIRTALDSLSASIDCDSMTVTFSYSY